jgi:uracil DNA glycosylase
MNAFFLVFGFEKRISDSAIQKSTIALIGSAHQSPVRDFDFLGCSAFLSYVRTRAKAQSARAFDTRSEASMTNALGAGRDTPRVIRG